MDAEACVYLKTTWPMSTKHWFFFPGENIFWSTGATGQAGQSGLPGVFSKDLRTGSRHNLARLPGAAGAGNPGETAQELWKLLPTS